VLPKLLECSFGLPDGQLELSCLVPLGNADERGQDAGTAFSGVLLWFFGERSHVLEAVVDDASGLHGVDVDVPGDLQQGRGAPAVSQDQPQHFLPISQEDWLRQPHQNLSQPPPFQVAVLAALYPLPRPLDECGRIGRLQLLKEIRVYVIVRDLRHEREG
jgi:hypothetical protein